MDNLLVETIESYNSYLMNLPKGCNYIAEKLREDSINDGLVAIQQFSEGLLWMVEVNDQFKVRDISVNLDISQIQEFLDEINSSLEIQDFILVADLFEYEIAEFFAKLKPIAGTI